MLSVLGQRKRGRSELLNLDMNRWRKIECITTPYSYNRQSIADVKLVSFGTDGQTNIIYTLLLDVVGLGAVKERQKWITKAGYELGAGRLNVLLVHTQTIFRWQACVLLRQ